MKVILDTNILIDAVKYKIDVVSQASVFGQPVVPDACINELKKLSDNKNAGIALEIAKKIKQIKTDENIRNNDKKIVGFALKNDCIVATSDKELLKTLKNNKIKTLRLTQKRYLAW